MFNIIEEHTNRVTYTESPQPNPLQWRILFREKEVMTTQAQWMKCRDYLNDVVAKRNGVEFGIYGFNNKDIKFNKYGLYIQLRNISNKELFGHNMGVLNAKLHEQLGVTIAVYDQGEGEVVIRLPNILLESTYTMSLATMMIRLSNYGMQFNSWEDFFSDKSPMNTTERIWHLKYQKIVKDLGFLVPEKYRKYWFYAGTAYNSKCEAVSATWSGTIHNNGAMSWVVYLLQEGAV